MTQQTASPTGRPRRPAAHRKAGWRVPVALLALSAIPVAAGTLRLIQLPAAPP